MKKILFCFLILFIPLFSDAPLQENSPKIDHSWDWSETFLFLEIELDAGLEFRDTYDTLKLQNGHPGAEIHFSLSENSSFVKNDLPLKDVTFTVYLFYDQNNHALDYKIVEKFIYEKAGWFSSSSTTTTTTTTGGLTDIDIDLSENPGFFIDKQSANKAYFVFKRPCLN